VTCSFQVESPGGRSRARVNGTLQFTAGTSVRGSKVRLDGAAARDLAGPGAPAEAARHVANGYGRQLLNEVACRLEELSTDRPVKAVS